MATGYVAMFITHAQASIKVGTFTIHCINIPTTTVIICLHNYLTLFLLEEDKLVWYLCTDLSVTTDQMQNIPR